ncbi:MAG TPA: hypothetical protein VFI95_13545 [Terriglobales bacterium]|nr:hypothetical protein [Terriglobales bacterium]
MRRNKAILQIAIAYAALCCTAIALGQQAETDSINGTWTVTFTIQGQTVSGQMTFQAGGEKLGGTVETQHTGQGTLFGGAWSHNKLSGIYVFEGHEAIAIAGELRGGELEGVFRTEGMDGKWKAVRAAARDGISVRH